MTPRPERHEVKDVVRRRIREVRESLGWSQRELAERMTDYGFTGWTQSMLAKIEAGTRGIAVDELVCVAFTFGISPVALLTLRDASHVVNITPTTQTSTGQVWRWMTGRFAMGGSRPDTTFKMPADAPKLEELRRRYDEAGPDYFYTAERRLPGVRRLSTIADAVVAVAGQLPDDDQMSDYLPGLLDELTTEVADLKRRLKRERARAQRLAEAGVDQ